MRVTLRVCSATRHVVLIIYDVELIKMQQRHVLSRGSAQIFKRCKGYYGCLLRKVGALSCVSHILDCANGFVIDSNNVGLLQRQFPPWYLVCQSGWFHVAENDAVSLLVKIQSKCSMLICGQDGDVVGRVVG